MSNYQDDFSSTVNQFWLTKNEVTLKVNLSEALRVMVLELNTSTQNTYISSDIYRKILKQNQNKQILTFVDVNRFLKEQELIFNDSDFLLYLPKNQQEQIASMELSPLVRKLDIRDTPIFEAFERACPENDFNEAYVELDHWLVYGLFVGDKLVSITSMIVWKNTKFADLGIVTLPKFRRMGYGNLLIHALCKEALFLGYEPQFRCQKTNIGSLKLAESSGFSLYGKLSLL